MFKSARFAAAVTFSVSAIFTGVGCQRHVNAPPPEAIVPSPSTDEAMLHRDWQQSSALYADTSVIAGNTGFMFMPKWGQPEWVYPLLDAPLFLANVVTLPVSLIMTPPWVAVEYRSATIPPSYTAMPPLPPEPPRGGENDLTQPPAPPSPEAQPMNATPPETPVPAPTVPPSTQTTG
jgi:hypothetical protein